MIGLLACALTGFFVSMLWPGSLVVGADRFPTGGVFIYAMMASGGDLGASVAPQLVGIITDMTIAAPAAAGLAGCATSGDKACCNKAGSCGGKILFGACRPLKDASTLKKH